jgi:hypothetical protein
MRYLYGNIVFLICLEFCFWRNSFPPPPHWARASSFIRFLDHTQRRTTVSRTPLDQWSARRRSPYLTAHNTHNRQTSMPPDEIRTHNLSNREAADLLFRPSGHPDRHSILLVPVNTIIITVSDPPQYVSTCTGLLFHPYPANVENKVS